MEAMEQELSLEEKFYLGGGGGPASSSYPWANRRTLFAACLILGFVLYKPLPIIGIPCLIAAVIFIFFTLKDPDCPINIIGSLDEEEGGETMLNTFSLLRQGISIGSPGGSNNPALYNKFIDVLIAGGVIDKNTEENAVQLSVVNSDPPTYDVRLTQVGKTERALVDACERAIFNYEAYLVDVKEMGPASYRVTYLLESEIDTLTAMGIVSYAEVLKRVQEEGE